MKFFYEAQKNNRRVTGAVEAGSMEDALQKLRQQGLLEARLLSTSGSAVLRNDLEKMDDAEVQRHAQREIAHRRTRTRLQSYLLSLWHVTQINAGYLLLGSAYLARGFYSAQPIRILIGVAGLLYPYVRTAWQLRHVNHYRDLQQAMALGEWAKARKLIATLRARPTNNEVLQCDLDVREAHIDVREGLPLAEALNRLEIWRQRKAASPGAFEGRVLGLYSAAKDYEGYLRTAREYQQAQPDEHDRRVELALAETRFGDAAAARQMLDSIDPAKLTPIAITFLDWTGGLLALREGNTQAALPLLEKTVTHYRVLSRKSPVGLGTLALSSAALALALARTGRGAEGQKLLPPVERTLRLSVDPVMRQQLQAELGWVA